MSDEHRPSGGSDGEGSAPVRVFMSYRRADDRHFVGRLHDQLCGAFGEDKVFRDIDSIPAGTNFRNVILNTLNEVDVVVAVIGPSWTQRTAGSDDPDYVFLELAEALKQSKPVIPTLIEDTAMPPFEALPSDLRPLAEINAIWVHGDPAFRRDCARLIEAIRDVVAADRARVAQGRRVAEELARREEAERSERARIHDQLREEERAARIRLAELEETAAQRQIDLERARLEAISEKLRLTESLSGATPPRVPDAPEVAVLPPPVPQVESPEADMPAEPRSAPPAVGRTWPGRVAVPVLVTAALVCGVVALSVNRSLTTPFNEFTLDGKVDVGKLILSVGVGVPLLFGQRPAEQRPLLFGATVSALFFNLLQESSVLHSGVDGFDEQSWFALRLVAVACLVLGTIIVRPRPSQPLPSSRQARYSLVALAAGCGALSLRAAYEEWVAQQALVDNGYPPDRTPFAVWFAFFLVGPICVTIVLAARRSYGARLALATIATFATVNYLTRAFIIGSPIFGVDRTPLLLTSIGYAVLAAVAWWTALAPMRDAHRQP